MSPRWVGVAILVVGLLLLCVIAAMCVDGYHGVTPVGTPTTYGPPPTA